MGRARDGTPRDLALRRHYIISNNKLSAAWYTDIATSGEVKDLRREASALKEVVADLTLENRLLKKSMSGDGEDEA